MDDFITQNALFALADNEHFELTILHPGTFPGSLSMTFNSPLAMINGLLSRLVGNHPLFIANTWQDYLQDFADRGHPADPAAFVQFVLAETNLDTQFSVVRVPNSVDANNTTSNPPAATNETLQAPSDNIIPADPWAGYSIDHMFRSTSQNVSQNDANNHPEVVDESNLITMTLEEHRALEEHYRIAENTPDVPFVAPTYPAYPPFARIALTRPSTRLPAPSLVSSEAPGPSAAPAAPVPTQVPGPVPASVPAPTAPAPTAPAPAPAGRVPGRPYCDEPSCSTHRGFSRYHDMIRHYKRQHGYDPRDR